MKVSFLKSMVLIGHVYHVHCPHTGMGKVPTPFPSMFRADKSQAAKGERMSCRTVHSSVLMTLRRHVTSLSLCALICIMRIFFEDSTGTILIVQTSITRRFVFPQFKKQCPAGHNCRNIPHLSNLSGTYSAWTLLPLLLCTSLRGWDSCLSSRPASSWDSR